MNSIKSASSKFIFTLALLAAVCGCRREEQKPVTQVAPAGQGIVSAEKTSFDDVTAKLDRGGNLYAYLSTEQTLSGLSDKLAALKKVMANLPGASAQSENINKAFDFADGCIKESGLEHISGVGMSSIAREPGFYYSKLVVHHYAGDGDGLIWSMFGKAAHPLQELDLLPETTVLAFFSDLDVPLVWKDVQEHVKRLDLPQVSAGLDAFPEQFKKVTGLDFDSVLSSLGGNYGVILTLDPDKKISLPLGGSTTEIPTFGLAIVAKVKSDVIFDRIDELAKGNPMVVRVDGTDLKMRTMTIPLPLPIELRPTIARSGEYLLLSTSDTMIHDILDCKAGKKKGFKSTAEFAHLSQGVPMEGNNFSLVSDQFIKSMMAIQGQLATNKGGVSQEQMETMQKVFQKGTNFGNFTVGANNADGWEGIGNGAHSVQSMFLPAVAGVGVAAAMIIPGIVKARMAAQKASTFVPVAPVKPIAADARESKPVEAPADKKPLG
jgi:hypothetical protein